MSGYTDVFGTDTIPPAGQAYASATLSANTQFYWPEMPGSANILTSILDVTATGSYSLALPNATQVSTGRDCVIYNVGATTFTITDTGGNILFTLGSGIAVYVYLIDNSTANGTWRTFTYGAGTAASASTSLAGAGLTPLGGLIVANEMVTLSVTSYTLTSGDRARVIAFTGGSVTATLPSVVTVGNGYFVGIRNEGTGTVTISPSGGVNIDSGASKALAPTEALICYTNGSNWYTIGHGRSTQFQFTAFIKDLTGISAYTMSSADASNKLIQFTGAPSAATTITIPSVVSVYYVQVLTSNAYTVTMKTATGTSVVLNQNDYAIVLCDGVNTSMAQTATVSVNVSVATGILASANGGTGKDSSAWTGIPKVTAGVWAQGAAGTDYVAPSAYASANGLTIGTGKLLGRTTAGTGAAEEISVSGATLSGGVLTVQPSVGSQLYLYSVAGGF